MNYSENDQKYYLVSLVSYKEGFPRFVNTAIVGVEPTTWILFKWAEGSEATLVNFWELSEAEFSSLDHDLQDSAWGAYEKYASK